MRAFHLAVKVRRPGFNIDMVNASVMAMPVKERQEFMAVIGSYGIDPEWELVDHMINKIDGIFLGMALVYLYSPDPGGIINSSVLKMPDLFTIPYCKE